MPKATHYGTCQACGRRQLLPRGLLADHGYEIKHGWRSGVCFGAGHLPFEQSIGLIQGCIEHAKHQAGQFRDKATKLDAVPLGDLTTWHRVYHRELSNRSRGSVYLWHEGLIVGERGRASFQATDMRNAKPEELHTYGTPEAIALQGRRSYAESLRARAKEEDEYVAWQSKRIEGWQPSELTPRA